MAINLARWVSEEALGKGMFMCILGGVVFDWKVESLASIGDGRRAVVRMQSFADSSYETPPAIAVLEAHGKRGFLTLSMTFRNFHSIFRRPNPRRRRRHRSCASDNTHDRREEYY